MDCRMNTKLPSFSWYFNACVRFKHVINLHAMTLMQQTVIKLERRQQKREMRNEKSEKSMYVYSIYTLLIRLVEQ